MRFTSRFPSFLPLLSALTVSVAAGPEAVWTDHSPGTDFDLNGVAWTGSFWVAVGGSFSSENVVYTSPDGAAWQKRTDSSLTGEGLNAVCWTGRQLVAVGPGGNVVTSPDGITWTQRPNAWPEEWVGVAWTGNLLVAVTGVGTILTSPDGSDWTLRAGGDGGPRAHFNGVAWSGSLAVAVGGTGDGKADGEIFTSPDGVVWTQRKAEGAPGLRAVAWTGSKWVAVGGIFDANGDKKPSRLSAVSIDGTVWTSALDSASEILQSVAWTGSGLVAVGWDGARMASVDGLVWTHPAADTLPRLQSVAFAGNRLVAVGWGSTIVTSPVDPVTGTVLARAFSEAVAKDRMRASGPFGRGHDLLGRNPPRSGIRSWPWGSGLIRKATP